MFEFIKNIFSGIKKFSQNLFRRCGNFFSSFFESSQPLTLTDDEKYSFIITLLNGQGLNSGFALRHASSDDIYRSNLQNGFWGDAVSYSVTNHMMSLVLDEDVCSCVWKREANNEYYFSTNIEIMPTRLDKPLAIRIFDVIHNKILQFMGLNFDDDQPHHFMLIKDMEGTVEPYDIKDIYPTGKCGKREVAARQIVKGFSKSPPDTAENMLNNIEREVIELYKPAKHVYSAQDTTAILSVLREIGVNAGDTTLTEYAVRARLTEAEYDHRWSDSTYESFFSSGGSFSVFKKFIPQINDDLEYFKHRL